MDYSKFFSKITNRRKANLIRKITAVQASRPNSISLAAGMPNALTFPIKDISVTYECDDGVKLNKHELSAALQYMPSQGYKPFLDKWREFQKMWHTPKMTNWDVMFTNGSMDGCCKIFEMILNENEPILIQSPLYTGTIGALQPLSPEIIEIRQDNEGIIPEEIITQCEQRLKDHKLLPKLLYVNPTGANPTGAILSESRRRRVYELAQKYDFLILEDDAYFFLHFRNKQPTSFFSLDTDGRVIRLDSFSKIVSAGIRIGVVTAHKDILTKLTIQMESSTLHSSSLSQMLLYKLFETWGPQKFEEHFKRIQAFYRERRDIMLAALRKHLTGLAEWNVPEGGMFVWVKLKAVDDVYDLVINKCLPNDVLAIPGNVFNYDTSKPSQYLRLSYSYASPEDIEKGLSVLAKILRDEIKKNDRTT